MNQPSRDNRLTPVAGPQEAAALATLQLAINAADRGDFEAARRCFAPEVLVDYSSLWGGKPQRMDGQALADLWQSVMPGFDATLHLLSDFKCQAAGATASASAHVEARHWLAGASWTLLGYFHCLLARDPGQPWLITSLAFALTQELGDRALAAQALTKGQAGLAA